MTSAYSKIHFSLSLALLSYKEISFFLSEDQTKGFKVMNILFYILIGKNTTKLCLPHMGRNSFFFFGKKEGKHTIMSLVPGSLVFSLRIFYNQFLSSCARKTKLVIWCQLTFKTGYRLFLLSDYFSRKSKHMCVCVFLNLIFVIVSLHHILQSQNRLVLKSGSLQFLYIKA